MNSPASPPAGMLTRSKLATERIAYFEHADDSLIESVSLGIVFVIAYWSSYSLRGFEDVTGLLAELDPAERISFVVVDADGSPPLYSQARFLGQMRGSGETAWVRDGVMIAQSISFNREEFIQNTRQLLEA